jgi:hypothetical protein
MKTNTQHKFGSLLTGVLLTSVVALPAAVIDQFLSPEGGQGVSISNGIVGTTQSSVQTGLTGVLGGSRELTLRIQAVYDLASLVTANVNGSSSNDQFALANSPNVDTSCRITWDANSGGMNANLSMDNRFNLVDVFNEIPMAYTLTMETFGGGISTQTVNTGTNFTGDILFPFSGFAGGASLTNIDRISLSFESGRSADVSIGALVTVPEPASAGLVVLSGFGLLLRRRRA